jgi:hypothetical protein
LAGFKILSLCTKPHLFTSNLVAIVCSNDEYYQGESQDEAYNFSDWLSFNSRFSFASQEIISNIQALDNPLACIGASHLQCNFLNYLGLGSSVQYMIDDDPGKISKSPPLKGSTAKIISTDQFANLARRGLIKSVIMTAFGYPTWSSDIHSLALDYGLSIFDPIQILEVHKC